MNHENKIKIIFAINDFSLGGAQRLIIDQLRFLDRNKFQPFLIVLYQFNSRDNFYAEVPDDVKIYRLNFESQGFFKEAYKLAGLLKIIKPDAVSSSLFMANLIFRLLAVFLVYKVFITEHNTYFNKTLWQKISDWLLSFKTEKIIAVSETVATFTSQQEKIPLAKFKVIPNGIDYEAIQKYVSSASVEEVKNRLGFKSEDKFIINVGRLINQKNHALLIEAFKIFSEQNKDYKLIIVGGGAMAERLKQQIVKLNLADRCFLIGETKNVLDYYIISDFFVLTSKFEGFCLAAIEAMACGLPVISTKVAGPDKFIKDNKNGFLADNSASAIATKIVELTNQPEILAKMRPDCLVTAEQFDIKFNVREYEKLISERN